MEQTIADFIDKYGIGLYIPSAYYRYHRSSDPHFSDLSDHHMDKEYESVDAAQRNYCTCGLLFFSQLYSRCMILFIARIH